MGLTIIETLKSEIYLIETIQSKVPSAIELLRLFDHNNCCIYLPVFNGINTSF